MARYHYVCRRIELFTRICSCGSNKIVVIFCNDSFTVSQIYALF